MALDNTSNQHNVPNNASGFSLSTVTVGPPSPPAVIPPIHWPLPIAVAQLTFAPSLPMLSTSALPHVPLASPIPMAQ